MTEATMLAIWVKARIKPEERQRFLQAIEVDALGAEREVYKDQVALKAHRATPHYATWRAAEDTLEGPIEVTQCQTIFPADRAYWGRP